MDQVSTEEDWKKRVQAVTVLHLQADRQSTNLPFLIQERCQQPGNVSQGQLLRLQK